MDPGPVVALAVVCLLPAAGLLASVLVLMRDRRRLAAQLSAALDDLAALEGRLDALTLRLEERRPREEREWVITTAPRSGGLPSDAVAVRDPVQPVTAHRFASVAAGESLVTLVSLTHGLRRALSAENRNRIGFEMRREVRRARKQRKRDLKEAKRTLRTADRADLNEHAA